MNNREICIVYFTNFSFYEVFYFNFNLNTITKIIYDMQKKKIYNNFDVLVKEKIST